MLKMGFRHRFGPLSVVVSLSNVSDVKNKRKLLILT